MIEKRGAGLVGPRVCGVIVSCSSNGGGSSLSGCSSLKDKRDLRRGDETREEVLEPKGIIIGGVGALQRQARRAHRIEPPEVQEEVPGRSSSE